MNRFIAIIFIAGCVLSTSAANTSTYEDTTINVLPYQGGEGLYEAIRQARDYRRRHVMSSVYQGLQIKEYPSARIKLTKGIYTLFEPLRIYPEDSNLSILGEPGTVLSGGMSINGWHREGKLWVADIPDFNGRPVEFRQLWINGRKAVRARDVTNFNAMNHILSIDKQQQTIWIPKSAITRLNIDVANSPYLEMVLHQMWEVAFLRIKGIKIVGDSAAITFHSPESRLQFEHPWPSPMVQSKHDSPFYLTNSKVLLDEPGEWFEDLKTHKLYYMPFPEDDMTTATVIAPVLENIIEIEGTPERRVENVSLSNITFSYATWSRPSFHGHVPLQAGMYLIDAYKLRPKIDRVENHKLDNQGWIGRAEAAVRVGYGKNVDFSDCSFTHLGGSGIDYVLGCEGGKVERCVFNDIAINGYVSGSFSPASLETHLPYRPKDIIEVCRQQQVTSSSFSHIGEEDWGSCAIAAGYVSGIDISHNEIHDVPYTGISLGWGWNRDSVCMRDNRIHANLIYQYGQHMYDCAGIYTLGNQPGTVIDENVVRDIAHPPYVHDPEYWFYLYTDEGSSNILLKDNWTPTEKYLKNATGPNNVWINNGSGVSETIINNAGIR